ncbi:MAG: hypothetical protein EOP88_09750 [Verrucomicrobiaceae bacterium]|nr:MAG: hypothetical protein EOP88_09750 [Verrucomicrobiaceae bacterium]
MEVLTVLITGHGKIGHNSIRSQLILVRPGRQGFGCGNGDRHGIHRADRLTALLRAVVRRAAGRRLLSEGFGLPLPGGEPSVCRAARAEGSARTDRKTAEDLFDPVLAASYREQDLQVLSGGEINDELELISNSDGSAGWYLATKIPMHDSSGQVIGIASVSRD